MRKVGKKIGFAELLSHGTSSQGRIELRTDKKRNIIRNRLTEWEMSYDEEKLMTRERGISVAEIGKERVNRMDGKRN